MGLFKTMGIVTSVAGVLLSAGVAFAEDKTETNVQDTTSVRTKPTEVRKEARVKMETAREETKVRMETAREEAKVRIETAREETKTRMETKREESKQRLNDIRDKKKHQMAERFTEQFDKLNKKWTDHFMQLLDRHTAILLKVQKRADIAATKGKDITAASAAIQSAKTAIESARAAVVAQASKSYALDASVVTTTNATTTASGQDELIKGLRTAFQDLHKTLFKDLYALRDGVMKDARAAVQFALQTLRQIPKVDDDSASEDN